MFRLLYDLLAVVWKVSENFMPRHVCAMHDPLRYSRAISERWKIRSQVSGKNSPVRVSVCCDSDKYDWKQTPSHLPFGNNAQIDLCVSSV